MCYRGGRGVVPPAECKRLRGYVLTCFHRLRTFAFQNPNESKMETKEMVISAQAAKLYERTWARFNSGCRRVSDFEDVDYQ